VYSRRITHALEDIAKYLKPKADVPRPPMRENIAPRNNAYRK
jgi:hypothetical protein